MLFPPFSTVIGVMISVSCVQADGTAKYSVAGDMTSHLNENSTAEEALLAKIAPANMYVGGADTVCPV
jgi:hypothetical protein